MAKPSMTLLTPFLEELGLAHIEGQLKVLGVESIADLAYVEDEDLIAWGLSTIQRRKFFRHSLPHSSASTRSS